MNYTDSRQSRATTLNINQNMIHATILTMTMSAVTCALLVVCVVVLVAKASHYMMS